MSNRPASRPSLQRKDSNASKKSRDEALDQGMAVTFEGKKYQVRMGDLSARDSAALRREAGFSFMGLLRAANSDPDIDIVAAIIWLARRRAEPLLAYDDVCSEIDYDADVEIATPSDDESEGEFTPEA